MMRFLLSLAFLLYVATAGMQAQDMATGEDEGSTDRQLWLDYNPSLYFKPHMRITGQLAYKTDFPQIWNRFQGRLIFRWTPKKRYERQSSLAVFEFHGGAGYYYTNNLESADISEIRLTQGFMASWPSRPKFRLIHYVRVEERFEEDTELDTWEFSGRMRYRVNTNLSLGTRGFLIHLYVPLNFEAFINPFQGMQFNDLIRVGGGLGIDLADDWRTELLISYHNVNDTAEDVSKTHDLVFRIRLFHNMEWKNR